MIPTCLRPSEFHSSDTRQSDNGSMTENLVNLPTILLLLGVAMMLVGGALASRVMMNRVREAQPQERETGQAVKVTLEPKALIIPSIVSGLGIILLITSVTLPTS